MPAMIPAREQAIVFREFATLIGAGIPISEALAVLWNRPISLEFRLFLKTAQERVAAGKKLSVAMREHPGRFSELSIALIEAGEESGRLEQTLAQVAGHLEREVELRNMISRETFYAKILIAAALFIPLAAKCIIAWLMQGSLAAIAVFLKGILIYALVGGLPLLAIYIIYRAYSGTQTGRSAIDAAKLGIPLLGPAIERLALARFARALATLYDAGISLPRAVTLAADTSANRFIGSQLASTVPHIEQGGAFSEALLGTRLADSLLVRMMQTGEQTGAIDQMMSKAADHYEDEAHTQIRRLAVAIVPVVTIIMGVVICIMVARFYLGLYSGLP